ncbi:TPA: hypothetical protein N0F65_005666 [Lagenidium giganteum]|uniref:Uncharacterized protein n=1 Tax=Lagenidium giganteum TaxID=4803 RepID=A0AAV2Z8Q0_9STRA|nr:TPA: hypothetical protein N0F65_005666 [Lagenidium giganteum]
MVSVSTMLLGLASTSALAHASYDDLPTYTIPSFNYDTLDSAEQASDILGALKTDGIVALNNVPNYEALRQQFLAKATECALAGVANPGDDTTFVSSKRFDDNTKRYTISTNAGLELPAAADDVEAKCPGYRALYQEFSATVERAVNNFGAALDKTSFTASDGQQVISSRKLVSEAVRLDHFHAYEAAQQQTPSERRLAMSLPLHEDHGLFIAMSAPKFFEVTPAGQLHERRLANDASGLIIQTGNGQRVRPVLKDDEVVIMMGTGASRWLKTSEHIPAVMHGMKMPESLVASGSRELRAWFGKMTLLPSYQRLLEDEHTVFDAHVNRTTRFLLQQEPEAKVIGCATGRRLTPSEGKCTLQRCTVKPGKSDPGDGCQTICNRENHDPKDAPNCKDYCDCSPVPGPAERCWMLCVANLPDSKCPINRQTCKDQSIVCKVT